MSKPPPFIRDSVSLGKHGRVWMEDVLVSAIQVGDIVRDAGLVVEIEERTEWDAVNLGMASGRYLEKFLSDKVTAFVRPPSLTEDDH